MLDHSDPLAHPHPQAPRWRSLGSVAAAPYAVLAIVAVAVVSWHMHTYPYVSPVDEYSHYDFIQRAPHIPAIGERLQQDTLDEMACRTFGPGRPEGTGPCGVRPYDPNVVPGAGFSTAGSTPPLYYFATASVARPLAAVSPWSVWEISRGLGSMWLLALMSICYTLAVRIGATRVAALGTTLFVCTTSDVVTSAATIGPDVATAATGGLVLLAALQLDTSARRGLLLIAATAAATLTKFTAFTAVGAAMIYVVVLAIAFRATPGRPGLRRSGLVAAGAFATFASLSFLWGLVFRDNACLLYTSPSPRDS